MSSQLNTNQTTPRKNAPYLRHSKNKIPLILFYNAVKNLGLKDQSFKILSHQ